MTTLQRVVIFRPTARATLSGLSLWVVLALTGMAQSAHAIDFALPDIEAAPGETVRIPLTTSGIGADALLSLFIDLRYDGSVLPPDSLSADRRGALISAWSLATNARLFPEGSASDGQLLMAGATASSSVTDDGTLLFLEVRIPASATVGAATTLSFAEASVNNGTPTVTTSNGSLTIVSPRIKADFSAHPLTGAAPLEVRFEDLSSDEVTGWSWDFGDGTTSQEAEPLHVYEDAGTFTVELTVTTSTGSATETKIDYITVTPDQQPPAIVEGPVVRGVTHQSADIFWKTNEAGDSQVINCGLRFRPLVTNVAALISRLAAESGESDEDEVAARLKLGDLSLFDGVGCTREVDERLQTNHNMSLKGLSPSTVYIYRVRSTDEAGNASRWRGGIYFTRGRPDDVSPRIISSVKVTATPTRAQIRWLTNESSNSFVSYSQDPGFADDVRVTDDELTTDHRVWIDVEPGTTYYVRVRSTDRAGNSSTLKRATFRTPRTDPAPVLLGDPVVTRRTASQVVILVRASEPVSVRGEYGVTEDYGASVTNRILANDQRILLNHLDPQTVYHFRAIVTDASGNQTTSRDISFVTSEDDDDDAPRFVLVPYLLKALHNQAVIAFETDEDATAVIEYGLDEEFGEVVEVAEAIRQHRHSLSGLSPGAEYFYRVLVTDLGGNGPHASRTQRFKTAEGIDQTPPRQLGPVRITRRTASQITAEWKTDEASSSLVEFGTDPADLDSQASDDELTKDHSVTLTGLAAGTLIHLRVTSTDAEGNAATGEMTSAWTRRSDTDDPIRILSQPDIVARTSTAVIVKWSTDRPARSVVEYGTSVTFDSEVVQTRLTRDHGVVITGLLPATRYFLQATSSDGDEASSVSSRVISVTTRAEADDRGPRLRHVTVSGITSTSALVSWRSDEPAGGWVEIGTTSGVYDRQVGDADLERRRQVAITGLSADRTYFYRLRAVDASGNETIGRERTLTTGTDGDRQRPRYVQRPTVITSHSSATFLWRTDESCYGSVAVGIDGVLGGVDEELFESDRAGFLHRITVTGLRAGQRYLFSVLSTDLAGNVAVIGDRRGGAGKVLRSDGENGTISFETDSQADVTVPTFTQPPTELSRSDTEVLIGWQTDEVSDTRLFLLGDDGSETLVEYVPDHDFAHQALLTGLTPGTTYTIIAASSDPSGNGPSRSAPLVLTTPVRADVQAPAFRTAPTVVTASDEAATITWATDEATVGVLHFGADDLQQRVVAPDPAIEQQVQLSGLQPSTTYRFSVQVTDGAGNETEAAAGAFTTSASADDAAPQITAEPQVLSLRPTGATIQWSIDEGGDGFVRFGTDPAALDQELGSAEVSRQHEIQLTNLQPGTQYHYQVSSADAWGNGPTLSTTGHFTTPITALPPAAPQGLRAIVGANGVVHLRWADADVVGWRVLRAVESAEFDVIAGPVDEPTYSDRGVTLGGQVRYRLTAVGAAGDSEPSDSIQLLVSLTAGDFTGDGVVDFDDFFILVDHLGRRQTDAGFEATADFDGDGAIGLDDIFAFVDMFGTRYGSARHVPPSHDSIDADLFVTEVAPGTWDVTLAVPTTRLWGTRLQYDATALRPLLTGPAKAEYFVLEKQPGSLTLAGIAPAGRVPPVRFVALAQGPAADVAMLTASGVTTDGRPWRAGNTATVRLLPTQTRLLQNAPNPFNPSTQIRFQLPAESAVWLTIYDSVGQAVHTLVGGTVHSAGLHSVAWDGRDAAGRSVASGIYFTVLQTAAHRTTGKLLLLR